MLFRSILAGFGTGLGDLVKSFFKRRIGIKPGGVWPVFDQVDYILGFLVLTYWVVFPGWEVIAIALVLTLILHPLTNLIAYVFKIKKVWW